MAPPPTYSVIEPHPSVPNSSRPAIHTSRGGAGNVINLKETKTTDSREAMGPPSRTRLGSHTPRTFQTGRGGAGNVRYASERPMFSFDEELERELRHAAPVYHVGRGGAGNAISTRASNSTTINLNESNRRRSTCSSATTSTTSSTASGTASTADLALGKARSAIDKGLGKLRQP